MKYDVHQVGAKKWSRDQGSRKKKGSEQRWEGPGWALSPVMDVSLILKQTKSHSECCPSPKCPYPKLLCVLNSIPGPEEA